MKASEGFMAVESADSAIECELRRRVALLENVLDDVAGLMEHRTGVRPIYVYEALLGRSTGGFDTHSLQVDSLDYGERRAGWENKLTNK